MVWVDHSEKMILCPHFLGLVAIWLGRIFGGWECVALDALVQEVWRRLALLLKTRSSVLREQRGVDQIHCRAHIKVLGAKLVIYF